MGEESPKKPHQVAAPPTRAVRSRYSVRVSSPPAAPVLRGAPTWIPTGQVSAASARAVTVSVGLESGFWAPSFNSLLKGSLVAGAEAPGSWACARDTTRDKLAGVGEGRAGPGPGRQMLHQRNQSHPAPWRRLLAHLLSSCPTRVDNAEGRGPLHSYLIERARARARSDAAARGWGWRLKKEKKKKKPKTKARSGGLALWTLVPDSPRTDQREAHGGDGDAGRGEKGGHRAATYGSLRAPKSDIRPPRPASAAR